MTLTVNADRPLYHPGETAHVTTTADEPYEITALVDGQPVGCSQNEPLDFAILLAHAGKIIVFEVVHGSSSATSHSHVA